MVKGVIAALVLFLTLNGVSDGATGEIQIQLPVRVAHDTDDSPLLTKKNLTLIVNGKNRKITSLSKREKSIANAPELGRNFVLSFHMNENRQSIKEAVSYFITELLNSTDSLIIVTPISAYQIRVSTNKIKVITVVEELVKRDCLDFCKKRISYEKNLENKIKMLNSVVTSGVQHYKDVNRFLNTFPRELNNFKRFYLFPDITTYRKVNSLLGDREGERWWIHFQQQEIFSLLEKTRGAVKRLGRFVSGYETSPHLSDLSRAMKPGLNALERESVLSGSFPYQQFLKIIIDGNFNYNSVYWGSSDDGTSGDSQMEAFYLADILEKISSASGGKCIRTKNPEEAVRKIENCRDDFYLLSYNFNGKIEEKKIQLLTHTKNSNLYYKSKFTNKEIETFLRNHAAGKVSLTDVSVVGNRLSFSIKSYKFKDDEKGNKYAILKVGLQLSVGDKTVYNSEKTLRVLKDKTSISLSLPSQHKGRFKLTVKAYDLIANTVASEERRVTL
ncbi:MAG: hypothetical protein GY757_02220 [bacterium]|nr:hypothetical protein [bacterium]